MKAPNVIKAFKVNNSRSREMIFYSMNAAIQEKAIFQNRGTT